MNFLKKLFIILWNTFSVIFLLALKIVSAILLFPIYLLMLLLTFFFPITYAVSALYSLLYAGMIFAFIKTGLTAEDIAGFIITLVFLAIPLVICGSCCLYGPDAAAGLLSILGRIIALPFNCLFIRTQK